MKNNNRYPHGWLLIILMVLFLLHSCVTTPTSNRSRFDIVPLKNSHKVELEAYDVISVMKRANFTDEQIIAHGRDLRNCLAINGAANVKVGEFTEMICAVQYPHLMVSTRLHGSFVYHIEANEYR